ncbi:glycerophosphodiester phosphodiesterase [Streptococcus suis]|nr:glycerophosphodiester phosphodiesterase [Streptococcus suis]
MRKRKVKKRVIRSTFGLFLLVLFLILGFKMFTVHSLTEEGYYPLDTILKKTSYKKVDESKYQKNENGVSKEINFDFSAEKVEKNGYTFDISNQTTDIFGKKYLSSEKIKEIFNVEIQNAFWGFNVKDIRFDTHQWADEFPNLIAHAGGTYRGPSYNTFYTNSLEALQQNYSLGHRVFEMDFYLTSDGKMAAVHDWEQFGYMNGVALSSEEWKNFQTFGSPITDSRFTTMLIGDVLDQMVINKDMFLVTDTKSFEISHEEMMAQFTEIYNEANKRDPELLNRIIPQIYNEDMFYNIQSIYKFPSVIFTLYATQSSAEAITQFASEHPEIGVITMSTGDPRFSTDFFESLHAAGKKVYTHTIHTYDDLTNYSALGVDGFYTGLLLPSDMERLESLK